MVKTYCNFTGFKIDSFKKKVSNLIFFQTITQSKQVFPTFLKLLNNKIIKFRNHFVSFWLFNINKTFKYLSMFYHVCKFVQLTNCVG